METIEKSELDRSKRIYDLSQVINSLIADEVSAWWMYWFMYQVSKGSAFHAISKELEEIAEDELNDHGTKLITWALANNVSIEVMPHELLRLANCPMDKFSDGINTSKVLTLAILSERCAIKNYKKYYEIVKDDYPDLGQLLMNISLDEQEHLNTFLDLGSQIRLDDEILKGTSLNGISDFKSLSNRFKEVFKYE